ncbi:hypothetical protein [Flavobacterium soli]|uniref:hypothetical protein n=1 Tax=Flavobacterium soli TaxID=344881 RepID=UPI0012FBB232|nr:hypothetical protein [Flavobacterium soli]
MKKTITFLFLTVYLVSSGQSRIEKETEFKKDSISNLLDMKRLSNVVESGEAEKLYREFLERREIKIKFEQKEWLKHNNDINHKSPRWNMISDLLENYLNSELNKSQIIDLLGKPFEFEQRVVDSTSEKLNLMLYPVGAYSGFGIDFDFLVIALDENNKKIKIWVEQH